MKIKNIMFQVNEKNLSGAIHIPGNSGLHSHPAIILVHGFVGSKVGEHRLFVKAARYFSQLGYVVFRFDFSGCGESDGDYGDVTVSNQIEELKGAIDFVLSQKEVNKNNLTVIGHSLGGAVSALTAGLDDRISQLLLWSPVARPYEDIVRITGDFAVKHAKETGLYDYNGFNLSHTFFSDLQNHKPLEDIKNFNGLAFIIHASHDEDVPNINAADYTKAINQSMPTHLSTSTLLEHADHTFSSYSFENELFELSSNWLSNNSLLPNQERQLVK
ncbi:alpha/beta hydrolase family protein [Anaerobacillus sp. MEB173]|uniref:alpha/beta hydrolase family protein n=1 Tax=Anaerobacillus sp. MEB173 TaxID=3383345 RepID=UPI003F91D2FC